LLTYFILPCTFRFLYSFKLPKRLISQKRGWRLARINNQPLDESDHLPHPSPKVNDESNRTLTSPVQYACIQYTVVTLLLHAYTVNQIQWNYSNILKLWMYIHNTVQNNHRNTPCFSSATTLTSFHRGTTRKNGIIVLMPDGESLEGILFNKIYPTCTVFYFRPRTFWTAFV